MGEVMSYRYSRPSADPAANTPGLVGLNCIPVMDEKAPLAPEREEEGWRFQQIKVIIVLLSGSENHYE
jgi:hypothetical protein